MPTLSTLHRQPFVVAAFLLPFVTLFQNKLLTVLLLVLTVAVLTLSRTKFARGGRQLYWPVLIGLGLLLLWALASAMWSIDPTHSLKRYGRLLPTVLAGIAIGYAASSMERDQRRSVILAVAAGMTIASLLAIFGEFVRSGAIGSPQSHPVWKWVAYWSFRPFSVLAAILAFPVLAMAIRRADRGLMIVAVAAMTAAVFFAGASASKLALCLGLPVFLLAWRWGRAVLQGLAIVLSALFILLPGIVTALDLPSLLRDRNQTLHVSAAHRLVVMRFVNERIDEHPVLGWGLHSSRLLPGGKMDARAEPGYADIVGVMTYQPTVKVELLPLHPHNASQQMRVELGMPGVLLYAALFALCCMALLRRFPDGPALAAGGGALVAAFVIGQLSFSAWQSWWISAQFLCVCLFLAMMAPGTRAGSDDDTASTR